jgi:hypothetical protein
MLIAKAGGGKRNLAQMARARALLEPTGILRGLDEDELRHLMHEETIVVEFEPAHAKRSLPTLVRGTGERKKLRALFDAIDADPHIDDRQRALISELRKLVPATTAISGDVRRVVARKRGGGRPVSRTAAARA